METTKHAADNYLLGGFYMSDRWPELTESSVQLLSCIGEKGDKWLRWTTRVAHLKTLKCRPDRGEISGQTHKRIAILFVGNDFGKLFLRPLRSGLQDSKKSCRYALDSWSMSVPKWQLRRPLHPVGKLTATCLSLDSPGLKKLLDCLSRLTAASYRTV